jgi:elongation factor Ts
MSHQPTAAEVKDLRDRTGAGMMDCKSALSEAEGDAERAVEILRVKGQAAAAKRGERAASEGTVQCYIHANGRVGAMVEVDCETDFVARNEDFVEFARDVALHVAPTSTPTSTRARRSRTCALRWPPAPARTS